MENVLSADDIIADSMDIHPCDTPLGMLYYKPDLLDDAQQKKLNDLKRRTVVEDEKYLAEHPQIRACVEIMMREVLKECPRKSIHETIARYFAQPRANIEADISSYINAHNNVTKEGDSHVDLETSATSLISQFDSLDEIIQTMSLDVTKSFRELGTHVSEQVKAFSSKRKSPVKKASEIFIRKLLAKQLESSLVSKEIENLEEVLRIESYRQFQEICADEETKSRESAGFVSSETNKLEISKEEKEIQTMLKEVISKSVGEDGEVEEEDITVRLIESVETMDVGVGFEIVEEIVTETQEEGDVQNLKSEVIMAEDVQNLKSEVIMAEDEHNLEYQSTVAEDEQNIKRQSMVTEDEHGIKSEPKVSEDLKGAVVTDNEQNLKN